MGEKTTMGSSSWRRGRRGSLARRAIALLAVMALVAACGDGDDAETDDTATDDTATDDAETDDTGTDDTGTDDGAAEGGDGEPVELTMWFNGETVPPDEFQQLEEEHNITVNYDIRGDDILPLMQQMSEAGEPLPDIIEIDTNTVPAYIEAGAIQPLDDLIARWEEEDPELYEDVLPQAWENGTFDGQIYQHANKAGFNPMYYNLEQIEQAGIDVPLESHHDILEAARTLQEEFPDLPEYYGTGGTSPDRMFYWSYVFDLPWVGEQENIPDLDTEQGYAMIQWLDDMYQEGLVNPEYMIGEQDESQGAFADGQLPLLLEGSNGGIAFAEAGWTHGDDYGTFPMPALGTGDEGVNGRMMVPRGLSITADTEHPYEASLVLRYLQEPEQAIARFTQLYSSPILSRALLESDELAERMPWFTPEIQEELINAENQIPPGTNTLAVGDVLKQLLDELTVTGTDESPEDLAARYMEELMALDG